jgi:AraC family transcriptional regulator of adaptative response/methylated-DNA-[protein]-cysteine methyltransferase
MSPSSYKNGAEGMCITFLLSDCSLGRLLVAGTGEGICGVSLGDSDAKLIAFLRAEYPRAILTELYGEEEGRPNGGLRGWVDAILEYLDKGKDLAQANLPLDLKVTAFQWKVLKELRKIPFGETKSYSEIANDVGCPEGSRAVGNACAANPVALVIPCHRVVRKSGELGGYRWGLERKEMLLEKERAIISNS